MKNGLVFEGVMGTEVLDLKTREVEERSELGSVWDLENYVVTVFFVFSKSFMPNVCCNEYFDLINMNEYMEQLHSILCVYCFYLWAYSKFLCRGSFLIGI